MTGQGERAFHLLDRIDRSGSVDAMAEPIDAVAIRWIAWMAEDGRAGPWRGARLIGPSTALRPRHGG